MLLTRPEQEEARSVNLKQSFGADLFDSVRYDFEAVPDALRAAFVAHHYVRLPAFLRPDGVQALRDEVQRLRTLAIRRDFAMACMRDSPRRMSTIGGEVLAEESGMISSIYGDPGLRAFLSALTGEDLVAVPDPVERHVLNFLHEAGDTHGAHFDDHPIAIVLFVESPPAAAGGLLEYVANAADLAELDSPAVRLAHHEVGDAYVLKTDTTAHRVSPLVRGWRRTVMNMAYTTPLRASVRSESASVLYSRA